jgi:hypothetical protein
MHCIILGTDHTLQPSDSGLKAKLDSILCEQIVTLIAEEVDADKMPNVRTVARDLTDIAVPKIHWVSIDMTTDQKQVAGIYERLKDRPRVRFHPDKGVYEDRVYFLYADGVREEFWLDRVVEAKSEGSVLIVCGYSHLESLVERAKARGWTAAKDIYLPAGEEAYAFAVEE